MSTRNRKALLAACVLWAIHAHCACAAARRKTGGSTVTPQDAAMALAQKAVAKARGVATRDVRMELCKDAVAPGLLVFRSQLISKKGRAGSYNTGVLDGETVILDTPAAIARVLRAWAYDDKRQAPAARVALVAGFLQGGTGFRTEALLNAADFDQMTTEWRPLLFAPREATVAGLPAVEYWVSASSTGDDGLPLWRTQLVIPPQGPARLTQTNIADLLQ